MNGPTDRYHAAMFRRLGRGVKLSRSGFTLVFDPPIMGRSDLSDMPEHAVAQLRAAGIDPGSATDDDVSAYVAWRDALRRARSIGGARILVTATHVVERGHHSVPANSVRLIDGLSEEISSSYVCERAAYWDREATNKLGQRGASCTRLDVAAVAESIARIRAEYPAYADAPVQDNSGEFQDYPQ